MNSMTMMASPPIDLNEKAGVQTGQLNLEIRAASPGDGEQFRVALEHYASAGATGVNGPASTTDRGPNIGEKIAARASDLAGEMKRGQAHVSNLLEKASSTGDSMHLMKAMLALNDYQLRVQTISKVVSKATTSLDQLTKLN